MKGVCGEDAQLSTRIQEEKVFKGHTVVFGEPLYTSFAAVLKNCIEVENSCFRDVVDPSVEIGRLRAAIQSTIHTLTLLVLQLRSNRDYIVADIINAQIALLKDPVIYSVIEESIFTNSCCVEQAVNHAMFHVRHAFHKIADVRVPDRYEDVEDLLRRLLYVLQRQKKEFVYKSFFEDVSEIQKEQFQVLFAFSLPPSIASESWLCGMKALVTCEGSTLSHTAVILKSRGVPYITAVSPEVLKSVSKTSRVLVDPACGMVVIDPSKERLESVFVQKGAKINFVPKERIESPQVSNSSLYHFEATAHTVEDIFEVKRQGFQSIGLFRTEYIAFRQRRIPTFQEQLEEYRAIFDAADGMSVTFRTFDFSSDKALFLQKEELIPKKNMGSLLRKPIYTSILREQMRAIIQAARGAPFRILFPMISVEEEVQICSTIFNELWIEALAMQERSLFSPPQIGIMIELPLAGVSLVDFKESVDFVVLGTNDLLQYALALDRSRIVSHQFNIKNTFCHMGFLHIVYHIIQNALKANIPLFVCGEMVAYPECIALLKGFGAISSIIAPKDLSQVQSILSQVDIESVQILVRNILRARSSEETAKFLQKFAVNFCTDR